MHRVQAEELQHDQGEEKSSGSYGNEEVLPFLQETHNAQGNEITGWDLFSKNEVMILWQIQRQPETRRNGSMA